MDFWIIAPWVAAEEMAELAAHAEELGFAGIMSADHIFVPRHMEPIYPYSADGKPPISGELYYPDSMITSAAMLMNTRRLQVSIAVYVLPLRNPIEVAKISGTLARISDNRFILGIGVGWMREEFAAMGVDFGSRGKRTDESIEVMRKLWQGGYVEHHGEFFDFPAAQLAPAPTQPVPIMVGGSSEPALRRAARSGDGWLGNGHSVDELTRLLTRLGQLRREYGRETLPFTAIGTPNEAVDFAQLRAWQELGMTGVSFGFAYDRGTGDRDGRMRAMERYAELIIRPWREQFG